MNVYGLPLRTIKVGNFSHGPPAGIATDCLGNIFAATTCCVRVYTSEGKPLTQFVVPYLNRNGPDPTHFDDILCADVLLGECLSLILSMEECMCLCFDKKLV